MGTDIALIIFAVIVLGPTLVIAVPLLMGALGLPISPIAALYLGMTARRRGLDTRRYAIAGAIASALFFWPCIYLIFRIHDKRVSLFFIRLFFVLFFIVWFLGPICMSLVFGLAGLINDKMDLELYLGGAVYTSLGVMNLWTLIVARRKLPDLSSIYDNQADGIIPPIGYARPLIYAFIAISITAIAFLGPSLLGWW